MRGRRSEDHACPGKSQRPDTNSARGEKFNKRTRTALLQPGSRLAFPVETAAGSNDRSKIEEVFHASDKLLHRTD
jgi:hypothetical protein